MLHAASLLWLRSERVPRCTYSFPQQQLQDITIILPDNNGMIGSSWATNLTPYSICGRIEEVLFHCTIVVGDLPSAVHSGALSKCCPVKVILCCFLLPPSYCPCIFVIPLNSAPLPPTFPSLSLLNITTVSGLTRPGQGHATPTVRWWPLQQLKMWALKQKQSGQGCAGRLTPAIIYICLCMQKRALGHLCCSRTGGQTTDSNGQRSQEHSRHWKYTQHRSAALTGRGLSKPRC